MTDVVFFRVGKLSSFVEGGVAVICAMPTHLDARMAQVARPKSYAGHKSTFSLLVDG